MLANCYCVCDGLDCLVVKLMGNLLSICVRRTKQLWVCVRKEI